MSLDKKNSGIEKTEKVVKVALIVLTFISIIITTLNMTYQVYQNNNIERINDFLVNFVNTWPLWLDNILVILLAIVYMILGIKSKKEILLKIAFSIFSIMTTMLVLTGIINVFASIFEML